MFRAAGVVRWPLLSGAFATLTQPPFDIFIAGFVSFPILVWLIDGAIPREDAGPVRRFLPAAMVGWWFGFGYFVSGLWWIGAALLVDADQFAWALPLAVLGLPAFLALFYALATMVARFFWSDGLGRILRWHLVLRWPNGCAFSSLPAFRGTPSAMQSCRRRCSCSRLPFWALWA
ncbi:hypothetical protein HED49_01895 [Ochrobactrum daejeonense]|nr:hypothetical protein [Brucella daejeonensis]